MRLHQIQTAIKDDKLHVELEIEDKHTPFCLVYSDGKAKLTKLPDHGETKVVTHQGKVKRVKWGEGEEF
ncbi:XtrA/YqaO family protein [Halobacillus salinus]|uniref:XtrA/YqaO family protein n=1 Tax=Halobacillus salinus TaxID=192814 RepID=UPI0009A875C6|nr:XtrA/YqaO family protein [Halobacillus salinus]